MKHWHKIITISLVVIGVLVLGACNLPSGSAPTEDDPTLLYTAAFETVNAQLTAVPVSTQDVNIIPTVTSALSLPTDTPLPSATLAPTNTMVAPTATGFPVPCDRGSFQKDITIPDDTELKVGETFVKTWRFKNTGSCTWNSNYNIVFIHGASMSGPASQPITSGSVAPGEVVDVSVTFIVPAAEGVYQGYWQFRNASGVLFGIGADAKSEFWVKIKAINPVPTATSTPKATVGFNFIDRGDDAEWRNTTEVIPWGDPPSDKKGVAVDLDGAKLENNKTYNDVLATYPESITDGFVRGLYDPYTVKTGDRFRTLLGFRANCSGSKARFQLLYTEGGGDVLIAEWLKVCDGNLLTIDQDLSSLAGKTVQFILVLKAEGSPSGDQANWVYPRIEKD